MSNIRVSLVVACLGGCVSGIIISSLVNSLFYFTDFPFFGDSYSIFLSFPIWILVVYAIFLIVNIGGIFASMASAILLEDWNPEIKHLQSISLLIVMLQVLGLFLVSSQTGKAVSRKLILYSLGRGETIIDKAIAVLVATKFIRLL